jgi:hypothetical protein
MNQPIQNRIISDGLTKKQEIALVALLTHHTIEEAANSCNVSRTMIFKYLQEEPFLTAYRNARSETVSHAIAQVQSACSEAVQVLRDIMNDKESPASSRVASARTIIETGIKAVELDELERRLVALEKRSN